VDLGANRSSPRPSPHHSLWHQERSRYQLFGDTVNTAARMESNGKRDRVHVSQQTADESKNAGKRSWFVPRSDKEVMVKGKGSLQTYGLVFHGETNLSGRFHSGAEEQQAPEQSLKVRLGTRSLIMLTCEPGLSAAELTTTTHKRRIFNVN
jgi:Adenylate and Guanylate cyclase catalytic domain